MSDSATPRSAPAATTTAASDPNIPADARAATIEGAEKFAAFWVSQFNAGVKSADPTPIVNVSSADCPVCQGFIKEIDTLRNHGQRASDDVWTVKNLDVSSFDNAGNAVVIATIVQNPVARIDGSGSEAGHYTQRTDDFAFTLVHNGSNWRTVRLQMSK